MDLLFGNGCLWKFDRADFKEAITLLLLNDNKEKNENDLELKKLIRSQFGTNTEMLEWAADLFEKVCKLPIQTESFLIECQMTRFLFSDFWGVDGARTP